MHLLTFEGKGTSNICIFLNHPYWVWCNVREIHHSLTSDVLLFTSHRICTIPGKQQTDTGYCQSDNTTYKLKPDLNRKASEPLLLDVKPQGLLSNPNDFICWILQQVSEGPQDVVEVTTEELVFPSQWNATPWHSLIYSTLALGVKALPK